MSEQNRKDLRKLFGLIEREGLTDIFMPPSMARLCGNQLCLLQRVFLGGEAVGGLYMDGPMLINDYGSSEAAMGVASFVIDKEYARWSQHSPCVEPVPARPALPSAWAFVPRHCM